MSIFTIGFTEKPAERFFTLLQNNDIKKLVDVRLNNVSQLAGFAKRDDLKYFLRELCQADYTHEPMLAPEDKMLKSYRNKEISWDAYEGKFLDLMEKRHIENQFSVSDMEGACLLCSEHKPHQCHRRLVVEYLNAHWGSILEVKHLV
jgi:uncharacterized protein (DUF488 family)